MIQGNPLAGTHFVDAWVELGKHGPHTARQEFPSVRRVCWDNASIVAAAAVRHIAVAGRYPDMISEQGIFVGRAIVIPQVGAVWRRAGIPHLRLGILVFQAHNLALRVGDWDRSLPLVGRNEASIVYTLSMARCS